MASAWFVGTGPALAATVVGRSLGAWDGSAADVESRAAQTHLALFVVQGLLLTGVISELRAARLVAEGRARLAQDARHESEAASRMKDEFLATISHELRTPLNAILGWVNLLRTGKLDSATTVRGLESIDRNVRLQAQLTTDLLDVSKALTGKLRLESRCVSVLEATREAAAGCGFVGAGERRGRQDKVSGRRGVGVGRCDAAAADCLAPAGQRHQVHAARRGRWSSTFVRRANTSS